jgi:hypothetical protein
VTSTEAIAAAIVEKYEWKNLGPGLEKEFVIY